MTDQVRPVDWLMKPGEVAAIMRVDPKTPVRWIKAGKIPAAKTTGNQHRFRSSDVIFELVKGGMQLDEAAALVEDQRLKSEQKRLEMIEAARERAKNR